MLFAIDVALAAQDRETGSSAGNLAFVVLVAVLGLLFIGVLVRIRRGRRARPARPAAPEPKRQPREEGEIDEEELAREAEEAGLEEGPAARPPVRPASAAPAAAKSPPVATDRRAEVRALARGLESSRTGFVARLGALLGKRSLDPGLVAEIEELLLSADVGVATTRKLVGALSAGLGRPDLGGLADPERIWTFLRTEARKLLVDAPGPIRASRDPNGPAVILVVGVNGVGKTTTIGKLASRLKNEQKAVVLAAADTFRAAADTQLAIWGERAGCPIVRGKEGADPGSVVYEAVRVARETNADVVLADTAGRLHTKTPLMEELAKVKRVAAKAVAGAPHEVLLVLDATTGQNAFRQAAEFKEMLAVTGIVLTKLDGTAKGGIVVGVSDAFAIPVRFVGVGERIEDLRPFDPDAFVEALLERPEGPKDPEDPSAPQTPKNAAAGLH